MEKRFWPISTIIIFMLKKKLQMCLVKKRSATAVTLTITRESADIRKMPHLLILSLWQISINSMAGTLNKVDNLLDSWGKSIF